MDGTADPQMIWDALQEPPATVPTIVQEPFLAICDAFALDAWTAAKTQDWPDSDLSDDQREARRAFDDLRTTGFAFDRPQADTGIPLQPGTRPLKKIVFALIGQNAEIDSMTELLGFDDFNK